MASLFLSYDHDDAQRAAPIAAALEKAGHAVWWDRHIKGGAEYNDEIEAAVEKADAVVVLWSKRSVRSAWVRDEAAEGRDRGKLVPVLIEAVKPPMGFRQFQTIDLSRSGRGSTGAAIQRLLDTIDGFGGASPTASRPALAKTSPRFGRIGWRTGLASVSLVFIALAGLLIWNWSSRPALAVVAVAASDAAPRSQALSSDLVVKLGTLADVGGGKWQLADPQSQSVSADLIFRVAGTGSIAQPQASLVLLDGKRKGVLWSRQYTHAKGTDADLRLQLSLTAGQVLGCALEAREVGGLQPDLLRLFLVGCAEEAEISDTESHKTARIMRTIIDREPRFEPAWSRLLLADAEATNFFWLSRPDRARAEKVLKEDMERARELVPNLRLLKLLDRNLKPLSIFDYAGQIERLARDKADAPDWAVLWREEASALTRVGRMSDAIESARRAVELDPLSPVTTADLIYTLAWSGRIDLAREELRKAERQWPGTGALRDAQWAFHLRYGDLKFAMTLRDLADNDPYVRARLHPTPANINAVVEDIQRSLSRSEFNEIGYSIQALGELNKTEEAFDWLSRTPPAKVAEFSYVLFRPGLAGVRRDARFMAVAKRIGLITYWKRSGEWPDFCADADLAYDCREEAAKLGA